MSRSVIALSMLGLSQMLAAILGLPKLQALAAATVAAPAPHVFARHGGLEPFSMRFALEFTDRHGERRVMSITPERYRALRGPYNRRNAYGAAIAAGPALDANDNTRAMLHSVLRHGLCGDAPLLRELGVSPHDIVGTRAIVYAPRQDGNTAGLPLRLEVPCA